MAALENGLDPNYTINDPGVININGQTFADAVVAYLVDSEIPERHFDAEELRGKLVRGGLIAGNELIWHMPKAIGSDPRFAWDASGQKVSIKV